MGISGGEFIVLVVVALIVVGPEKLPKLAAQLARWVKAVRRWMEKAKKQAGEELGPEVAGVDWDSLDPRRYDPRRVVRDALLAPLSSDPDPDAADGPQEPLAPIRPEAR